MSQTFDIIADTDTPVSAFLKLQGMAPRYLLESVEGGTQVARYSFIGFGEALEVRLLPDRLTIDGVEAPRPTTREAMLAALRNALARAPRPKPDIDIPFVGGLVGAGSYDLVRDFERLPTHAERMLDEPDGAWVATQSILVFDHLTRRVALLHEGTEAERRALRDEVIARLRGPLPDAPGPAKIAPARQSLSRQAFLAGVDRTQAYIRSGDVFQLVLSVSFEGETELHPFTAYRALRLVNPSPYMFYCDMGELTIVGSSPEALVRLDRRGYASLRPIAGTRPRGENAAADAAHRDDLLADAKENAEHVMLVDLARNDLGRVAQPGSIVVEPYKHIENYSHVMHMVSGVRGQIDPTYDQFDLFAAAFPAGTLVGAPKVRAMEIIDELEPQRRGIYGGTVGYFGTCGAMDQAIAIRTLVFREGTYRYQAGAGIVADSLPHREYDEVLSKGAALERALILASEGWA